MRSEPSDRSEASGNFVTSERNADMESDRDRADRHERERIEEHDRHERERKEEHERHERERREERERKEEEDTSP